MDTGEIFMETKNKQFHWQFTCEGLALYQGLVTIGFMRSPHVTRRNPMEIRECNRVSESIGHIKISLYLVTRFHDKNFV